MRIGIGYDVHPFVEGRKLFLGGVQIPFHKGLEGHSDGDVLLHAIADALLGAIAERDIGYYFPDTENTFEGIKSEEILKGIMDIVMKKGFKVVNIDALVKAEEPMISAFRELIRENIARICMIDKDKVSVKGKRGEGLGYVGEGRAIEVFTIVLLEEVDHGKSEICT